MLHQELNWKMALERAECQVLGVWTTIFGAWTTIVATCHVTTCFGKGYAQYTPIDGQPRRRRRGGAARRRRCDGSETSLVF